MISILGQRLLSCSLWPKIQRSGRFTVIPSMDGDGAGSNMAATELETSSAALSRANTNEMSAEPSICAAVSGATNAEGTHDVALPDTDSVLWLRTDEVSGRVSTKGAPYAQVSLERKVWPAREQDMARLEQSLDAGDGATCCICLEAMDEYENVVVTACGHAFHASCCRQSEYVEVRATACWKCPICRDEVTTAHCCYKNILLDQSPLPETTGAGLATLIKGNIILREVLDHLLQLGVVGCRRAPTSTAASDTAGLLQTAAEQLLDARDGDRFGRARRSAADWSPGVAQSQLAIRLFPPAGLVRTDEEMMSAMSSVRQRVFAAFGCFPSMWRSYSAQLQRGSVGYRSRHPPEFP